MQERKQGRWLLPFHNPERARQRSQCPALGIMLSQLQHT